MLAARALLVRSGLPPARGGGSLLFRSFASVGDRLPSGVEVFKGFPDVKKIDVAEHCRDKSIIILGLPGAFTPTWSNKQIPSYKEHQDALREAGIDETLVYCVNDSAVMQAWAKDQKVGLTKLNFVGDPAGELTKALDMEMTAEGPRSKGLFGRCKRHAIHVVNGTIKAVRVSEAPDDPAGDNNPAATLADAMIEAVKAGG